MLALFLSFSMLYGQSTINVGIMLPLSGDAAPYGIGARKGAELAYEELGSRKEVLI